MAQFKPTEQQQAIVDAAVARQSFVVQAGAGTGKTTTMLGAAGAVMAAGCRPGGLYLAYNRAAKESVEGRLPAGFEALTGHGLAYRHVGRAFAHRLRAQGSVQPWALAKYLRTEAFVSSDRTLKVAAALVAGAAKRAVKRFCYTGDFELGAQHVACPVGVERGSAADAEYRQAVLPGARKIWEQAQDPNATALRYEHDWYQKIFQLWVASTGFQVLPEGGVVILDEGQDTNGCMEDVFLRQHQVQRIAVGDSAQSIYAWRGATDSLGRLERAGAPTLYLTRSFRFGQPVADEGNKWLTLLGSPMRIEGDPNQTSTVGKFDPTARHAVLCRTNAGVISEVIGAIGEGYTVAVAGGVGDVLALVEACGKLQAGKRTTHPDLTAFDSWRRLAEYVESDECDDGSLRTVIRLVISTGADKLIRVLRSCVDEKQAHVVVSTSHSAKGLEWPSVRIGGDYPEPKPTPRQPEPKVKPEDARLAYVAVTRARQQLDPGGLGWVDSWV